MKNIDVPIIGFLLMGILYTLSNVVLFVGIAAGYLIATKLYEFTHQSINK